MSCRSERVCWRFALCSRLFHFPRSWVRSSFRRVFALCPSAFPPAEKQDFGVAAKCCLHKCACSKNRAQRLLLFPPPVSRFNLTLADVESERKTQNNYRSNSLLTFVCRLCAGRTRLRRHQGQPSRFRPGRTGLPHPNGLDSVQPADIGCLRVPDV